MPPRVVCFPRRLSSLQLTVALIFPEPGFETSHTALNTLSHTKTIAFFLSLNVPFEEIRRAGRLVGVSGGCLLRGTVCGGFCDAHGHAR